MKALAEETYGKIARRDAPPKRVRHKEPPAVTERTFDGPGKVGGYAVLNVNAEMGLGAGWQAFARINNLFDRRYASGGALAENPFVGGSFQANSDHWRRESFVAPGAPRAA